MRLFATVAVGMKCKLESPENYTLEGGSRSTATLSNSEGQRSSAVLSWGKAGGNATSNDKPSLKTGELSPSCSAPLWLCTRSTQGTHTREGWSNQCKHKTRAASGHRRTRGAAKPSPQKLAIKLDTINSHLSIPETERSLGLETDFFFPFDLLVGLFLFTAEFQMTQQEYGMPLPGAAPNTSPLSQPGLEASWRQAGVQLSCLPKLTLFLWEQS